MSQNNITNQQLAASPTLSAVAIAFNRLVTELFTLFQALGVPPSVTRKTLNFETGAVVANSFPIDIPASSGVEDIHVAQVISGPTTIANSVTVQWHWLSTGKTVRIDAITGLSASKHYSIRLSMS
jgi:hypothetical protein